MVVDSLSASLQMPMVVVSTCIPVFRSPETVLARLCIAVVAILWLFLMNSSLVAVQIFLKGKGTGAGLLGTFPWFDVVLLVFSEIVSYVSGY